MNADSPTPAADTVSAQIPIAVDYGRPVDVVPPLLIRIIGVMLLILGSMSVLVFCIAVIVVGRNFVFPRGIGHAYATRILINRIGQIATQVLEIWSGVLCLRTPLRGRWIILLWGYLTLAVIAYFTVVQMAFIGVPTQVIRNVSKGILEAQNLISDAAFPLLCLLLFHSAGVRRIFASGRT